MLCNMWADIAGTIQNLSTKNCVGLFKVKNAVLRSVYKLLNTSVNQFVIYSTFEVNRKP